MPKSIRPEEIEYPDPILPTEIEYYDTPEDVEIELHFENYSVVYPCKVDLSHNNIVEYVCNKDGEVIATCMEDLKRMGVLKAFVLQKHEVKS